MRNVWSYAGIWIVGGSIWLESALTTYLLIKTHCLVLRVVTMKHISASLVNQRWPESRVSRKYWGFHSHHHWSDEWVLVDAGGFEYLWREKAWNSLRFHDQDISLKAENITDQHHHQMMMCKICWQVHYSNAW